MREIKFRAWDGNQMWLHPPVANGKACMINIDEGDLVAQDWELMQYTGLKDKNGREIYEGDILGNGDMQQNGLMKWSDKIHGWVVHCGVDYTFEDPLVGDDDEVIGNIYENPDLLEV